GQLLATGQPTAAPPPRSIESMTSIPPPVVAKPPLAPAAPAYGDPALKNPWNEGTPKAVPSSASTPRESPPSAPISTTAVASRRTPAASTIRLRATGGTGLLRRYDVSSTNVADSGLSFPLDPTSLVRGGVEFQIPSVSLGFDLDAAFRPIRYEVGPVGEEAATPGGSIFDVALWTNYYLPLSNDEMPLLLIPRAGGRLERSSVEEHRGNFVVSSTSFALLAGLGLRWPVNRTLELAAFAEGGWLPSYSESPAQSGDSATGFTLGGDVNVRIWLTSLLGIAIDSRYRYNQINFDGVPSRQVPDGEVGQLENLTVATQDLLTSIGLALRL
ncbi:MAG: hypothetical protein AAF449_07105, partial [Myxococcota bacterium]